MKHISCLRAVIFGAVATGALGGHAQGSSDSPDVVIEWNQLLQANHPATGPAAPRYYAMLHVAMFDAVNAIERDYSPYGVQVFAPAGASAEAAAAQAGHDILAALIPGVAPTFATALKARLDTIQPALATLGKSVGRKVALEVLASRQNDGYSDPNPAYVLPLLPGLWRPTPPMFLAAAFVNMGSFKPFALLTSTQYLPKPPPTLTSAAYAADFEEVKRLGSATSAARTAEQTLLARLFAPVGYRTQHWAIWNNVARDTALDEHLSLVETARLFALLNVSIHDSVQTSQTSKFIYGLWRPVTAIQRADEDLNPSTSQDVGWLPLLNTPPYPSHASNQACVGAGAARALARAFGTDAMPFTATWLGAGNPDVTRSYTAFSALSGDQGRSRVYGGIHFTFEITASEESCTKVADYVFDNYMQPN